MTGRLAPDVASPNAFPLRSVWSFEEDTQDVD
jgi:hypothetical protein